MCVLITAGTCALRTARHVTSLVGEVSPSQSQQERRRILRVSNVTGRRPYPQERISGRAEHATSQEDRQGTRTGPRRLRLTLTTVSTWPEGDLTAATVTLFAPDRRVVARLLHRWHPCTLHRRERRAARVVIMIDVRSAATTSRTVVAVMTETLLGFETRSLKKRSAKIFAGVRVNFLERSIGGL